MPVIFTRLSLRRLGFSGFMSVAELSAEHSRGVPERQDRQWIGGVYIAIREVVEPPRFKRANRRAEWTLPVSMLSKRWVHGSPIIYIGKADATDAGNNLRTRVSRYVRAASSHTGGKRTWQLAEWSDLVIAWRAMPSPEKPRSFETTLLARTRPVVWSTAIRERLAVMMLPTILVNRSVFIRS